MELVLRLKNWLGRRRRWPIIPVWVERRITPGQPDAYAILAPPSTLKLSISFPDGHPGGTVGFGPEVREVTVVPFTGSSPAVIDDYAQFGANVWPPYVWPPDLLAEVDAWRESQVVPPSLGDALATLVRLGLGATPTDTKKEKEVGQHA